MRERVQKSCKAILALLDAGLSEAASRLVSLSKSHVCLFICCFFGFTTFQEVERCLCRHFDTFLRFETIIII